VLGDSSRKGILAVSSNAEFANGSLLYVRQNNLIAHPFDPGKLELTGDPIPIAERVIFGEGRSRSDFSFSQSGLLVYQSGNSRPPGLFLADRTGKLLSQLKTGAVSYAATFSPDGKRIVLDSFDATSRNFDIWVYDIARGLNTRFTFDAGVDIVPTFSPDGNKVIFSSDRTKSPDLYIKDISGMSNEVFLYGSPLEDYVTSWSPDGTSLLLSVRGDPKTKWDLLLLPLTGEKKPMPLAQTEFNEWIGKFSPDGRWVVYQSDESGKYEIYVRTLDPRGGKWQVSSSGGGGAQWLRKSNEIIYTTPDQKVMSATVKYSSSSFEVVRTTHLFDLNIKGAGTLNDVTADGQTFLVELTGIQGGSSPVTLVMNWQEELKKK
jgi:dipeptidyl aminopeptidase/acylaminoacyl peptidase